MKVNGTMEFNFKTALCAGGLALGSLLALGTMASAATIDAGDIGKTLIIDFNCDPGDPCPDAGNSPSVSLSATLELDLDNYYFSGGQTFVEIGATLLNTTLASTTSSRINSVGFGVDPDAVGISVADTNTDGIDWSGDVTVGNSDGIPGFKNVIDLCIFTGNNCSSSAGGASNGVQSESFDVFDITLTFDGELASFNISPYAVKFSSVSASGGGSYEFGGTEVQSCPPGFIGVPPKCQRSSDQPPSQVPLPAGLPLLIAGLGALAYVGKRRKAA